MAHAGRWNGGVAASKQQPPLTAGVDDARFAKLESKCKHLSKELAQFREILAIQYQNPIYSMEEVRGDDTRYDVFDDDRPERGSHHVKYLVKDCARHIDTAERLLRSIAVERRTVIDEMRQGMLEVKEEVEQLKRLIDSRDKLIDKINSIVVDHWSSIP
jgi:hypothetical protein